MKKGYRRIIGAVRLAFVLAGLWALGQQLVNPSSTPEHVGTPWLGVFTALGSLALTAIPDLLARVKWVRIPLWLQAAYTLFILLAMFGGEILHFYRHFPWWDSLLHLYSGVLFSMGGYVLLLSLNRGNPLSPASLLWFAFCFSLACGMVWETYEYVSDTYLGMNMQRWRSSLSAGAWAALQNVSNRSNPGLMDTMKDILLDISGALISLPLLQGLAKRRSLSDDPAQGPQPQAIASPAQQESPGI